MLQNSQVHAPRPHSTVSDNIGQAIWAPLAFRPPQPVAYGQDDMARQIRAKFENLVRASPLPKASLACCATASFCVCGYE